MFTLRKLKRLSAMPVSEILYRLWQLVRDQAGKRAACGGKTESLELFVSRLAGQGETLEDKFNQTLLTFQSRNFFAWQKSDRQHLVRFFEQHYPQALEATRAAAEKVRHGRFDLFSLPVSFEEEINWHYDPLLQKNTPLVYWRNVNYYSPEVVKDVKYVWELNRCQHFVTLAKAYYLTEDENFAAALFSQWGSWMDKNPYKMGVNWTSALECAFRLLSWTWALVFARLSGHLHAGLFARILQSIKCHAQFISEHLSKYSSANNHIIGEALGLIYAGTYFPELPDAIRWRTKGFEIFTQEFLRQVHSDGVTVEQTTYYQKYVFDFGVLAVLAAQVSHTPIDPEMKNRLEKMAEFYAAITDQNGNIPQIGDDDGGCAVKLTEIDTSPAFELLSTAAVLFERPDFKAQAGSITETPFWLFGEKAFDTWSARPAVLPRRNLYHFEQGGYVILDQHFPFQQKMLFDCGPLGLNPMAAHGHADALSITLSVDGQPVLIDCGTWLYLGAGDERRYFRSTRAHNTLTVNGADQSEMIAPFQWGKKAHAVLEEKDEMDGRLFVQASHDGYRKLGVTHQRSVKGDDGMWIIKDLISGVGNHQIDVYFHCLASQIEQLEQTVLLRYPTFTIEFQFNRLETQKDHLSINKAWHSPRFGQREQHSVIHRQVTGPLPHELTTTINVYA